MWSLVSSGYWYLMLGPGPSSKATNMNVAGTFSWNITTSLFPLIHTSVIHIKQDFLSYSCRLRCPIATCLNIYSISGGTQVMTTDT